MLKFDIQPTTPISHVGESKIGYRGYSCSIIFSMLLLLVGTFLPFQDFWGFNHLAYLSWTNRSIVFVLCLFALMPLEVDKWYDIIIGKPYEWIFQSKLGLCCLTVASGVVFAVFRQRTHFLGDGYLLLDWLRDNIYYRPTNGYSFMIKLKLFHLFNSYGISPLEIFQAVSIFAGMAGVIGLVTILKQLHFPPWRKMFMLYLYFGSGPTLLYFGYVENYSLLLTLTILFLVASVGYSRNELSIYYPATLLGLSIMAHLFALVAILPFLVLVWSRRSSISRSQFIAAMASIIIPVPLVLIGYHFPFWEMFDGKLISYFRIDSIGLLKPISGKYGIFSIYNLESVVNLMVLVSPVSLITIIGAFRRKNILLRGATATFLVSYIAVFMLFIIVVDPKLGASRDWDLFSIPGAGLVVWASLVFPDSKRLVLLAVRAIACFAVAWLLLSSSTTASEARFSSVINGFPNYMRGYAYETLGTYYRNCSRPQKAMEAYRQSVDVAPGNARFHALLGASYVTMYNYSKEAGRPDETYANKAEACFRKAMSIYPDYSFVQKNLALLLVRKQHYQEAEKLLTRLSHIQKLDFPSLRALGYCQLQLGEYEASVQTLKRAKEMYPRSDIQDWIDIAEMHLSH